MGGRKRPSSTAYPENKRAPVLIGCMALLLTDSASAHSSPIP